MTTLEIIDKTEAVIDTEEKWTTEYYARNKYGYDTPPCDPTAVCWCVSGAFCVIGKIEGHYDNDDFCRITEDMEWRKALCLYLEALIEVIVEEGMITHPSLQRALDKVTDVLSNAHQTLPELGEGTVTVNAQSILLQIAELQDYYVEYAGVMAAFEKAREWAKKQTPGKWIPPSEIKNRAN